MWRASGLLAYYLLFTDNSIETISEIVQLFYKVTLISQITSTG